MYQDPIDDGQCTGIGDLVPPQVQVDDHVAAFEELTQLEHVFVSQLLVLNLNDCRLGNAPTLNR